MDDRERKMKELELLRLKEQEWQWQQSQKQQAAPAQGMISRAVEGAGNAISGAAQGVAEAWQGKHDPAMSHVRPFEQRDAWNGMDDSGMAIAKMTGTTDETYGNQVASLLKQKGYKVELFKDAEGYPMISYAKDGMAKTRRLNEPGMDWGDVDRGVMQAAPYVATGVFGAGRAAGMGLLGRMGVLGATEAGTSVASDVAGAMNDSGITVGDMAKNAALAGTMGAGGEAAFSALIPVVNAFVARGLYKGGKLTPAGEQLARENGLNPDEMTAAYQKTFAKDVAMSAQPEMAARKNVLEQTGAPISRARVTLDPEDIRIEQDLMKRRYGGEAADRFAEQAGPQAEMKWARERADQMIDDQTGLPRMKTGDAGDALVDSMRDTKAADARAVEQSWEQVDRDSLRFKQPAKLSRYIPKDVKDEIDGLMGEKLNSRDAYKLITDWTEGKLKTNPITPGAEPKPPSVLDIRDTLGGLAKKASKDSAEYRRIATMQTALDSYVASMAGKGFMNERTLQEYLTSYDMSRQFKAKWQKRGSYDPGGDFVEKLMNENDVITPSKVVDAMFGSTFNPTATSLSKAKRVAEIIGKDSSEAHLVRATMMSKATENANGGMLPPTTIKANLERMLRNEAVNEFLDDRGRIAIRKYIKELDTAGAPDPLTGRARLTQELSRKKRDSMLRYWLSAKGSGARFTNRPAHAIGWHFLARKLPNVAGIQATMGKEIAEGQLNKLLPKRRRSGTGGIVGGAASTQIGDE